MDHSVSKMKEVPFQDGIKVSHQVKLVGSFGYDGVAKIRCSLNQLILPTGIALHAKDNFCSKGI